MHSFLNMLMLLGQVYKRLGCQVFQASESPGCFAPESISALFSAAPPKSCLESVRITLLHCSPRASIIEFLCRYYINTFYPGAALKIQAFFRRIRSGSLIAQAQLRKLRISQSVFALVIQRVVRGHLHRQFIVQFHASALTVQRAFRGHRSRCVTKITSISEAEAEPVAPSSKRPIEASEHHDPAFSSATLLQAVLSPASGRSCVIRVRNHQQLLRPPLALKNCLFCGMLFVALRCK
jgi:hypothetical protein